jgi:DNA-directed RNA polymerase specialized sigma24 family protein
MRCIARRSDVFAYILTLPRGTQRAWLFGIARNAARDAAPPAHALEVAGRETALDRSA